MLQSRPVMPKVQHLDVRFKQLLRGQLKPGAVLEFGNDAHAMPGLFLPVECCREFGWIGPSADGYLAPQSLDEPRVVLVWQYTAVLKIVVLMKG